MLSNSATKRQHEEEQSYPPSHNTTIEFTKQPLYSQTEYPHIKYWTKQQWRENENSTKDASDLLDKEKTRGGTRSAKGENVMMLYIEHKDGTPVDGRMAAEIREHARMVWKDLYQRGKAPEKWTDAPRDVREQYFCEMEGRWEVLRYCDNHWKANKLATALYSVWYNQYHKKTIKSGGQNNHAHEAPPPNKKARPSSTGTDSESRIRGSPEPENQAHGRAVSENPTEVVDGPVHELDSSPCHIQIENRATTSQASSRPRPRPLRDPL